MILPRERFSVQCDGRWECGWLTKLFRNVITSIRKASRWSVARWHVTSPHESTHCLNYRGERNVSSSYQSWTFFFAHNKLLDPSVTNVMFRFVYFWLWIGFTCKYPSNSFQEDYMREAFHVEESRWQQAWLGALAFCRIIATYSHERNGLKLNWRDRKDTCWTKSITTLHEHC